MTQIHHSYESNRRPRRGHGRVTLQDIAVQAGVTSITVSRYLRQPHKVMQETQVRIEAAIQTLGYIPNQQAGQLASGRSHIVAALIPNIGNTIFAETVQGLSEGLDGSGYELMLMATRYSRQREAQQLRAVMGWSPAAVLVTGRHHNEEAFRLLQTLADRDCPVLQMWDFQPDECIPGVAQVGFDHFAVGKQMANHLLDLGHLHTVYIDSSVQEDFRAHERADGYVTTMKAAGAKVVVRQAGDGDPVDAGRVMLQRIVDEEIEATALAFANDQLACGAMLQAQVISIPVPDQLSILGFGDFNLSRQLPPGLSTVHPPRIEIGLSVALVLLDALQNQRKVVSQQLTCTLMQRGSTARPSLAK